MALKTQTSTALLHSLDDPSDKNARDELSYRYRPLVMAVARRAGLGESEAHQVAAATIGTLIEDYQQRRFRDQQNGLHNWLRDIGKRRIMNALPDSGPGTGREANDMQAGGETERIGEPFLDVVWQEERQKAILRQCLKEIRQETDPKLFEAFELYVLQQWPLERVAARLRLPDETIAQCKSVILGKIRELTPQMSQVW